MLPLEDLRDKWAEIGSEVRVEGDAEKIDALLSTELVSVAVADDGWRTLYRHCTTGMLWELSYPQAGMHGGGPRRLQQVPLNAPEDWR